MFSPPALSSPSLSSHLISTSAPFTCRKRRHPRHGQEVPSSSSSVCATAHRHRRRPGSAPCIAPAPAAPGPLLVAPRGLAESRRRQPCSAWTRTKSSPARSRSGSCPHGPSASPSGPVQAAAQLAETAGQPAGLPPLQMGLGPW